ncbi:acetate/propionate family kinase [Agrobacterium sp. NPDC090273]|uniref:acetate/propionate family kinase n=1 Tax=Agrobacterium sp. NPDC090273 TaxID=3363919 RepID=UPI00383AA4F9
MIDILLVLNTGSSSLKFEVFGYENLDKLAKGKVAGIGTDARLTATIETTGTHIDRSLDAHDHVAAMGALMDLIDRFDDGWHMVAAVHRIVHGGPYLVDPVIVTPQVRKQLEALVPLAPLHQPYNLAGIDASDRLADAPDIACFDTAFHTGQNALFRTFAVEEDLRSKGIRRHGFHGISYDWISRVLVKEHPDLASGKVVVGHLGNGASLCALSNGRSIDTTMGMTALDGLPMGSRPGAIDAGAVTYMLRALGMPVEKVEEALYERSGLKGLSGVSSDVKTLMESDDPQAQFTLDYLALKVAQYTAMMAVSMGGIDALVFTGGVGENATSVRDAVLARLAFLQPFKTLIIPANEERMMAIYAKELLEKRQS